MDSSLPARCVDLADLGGQEGEPVVAPVSDMVFENLGRLEYDGTCNHPDNGGRILQ